MKEKETRTKKDRSINIGFSTLSPGRKIQLAIAFYLTIILVTGIPTYSWFKWQREIARFERIDSPNSLFLTAAHREDSIYLEMGAIDVSARWKDSGGNDYGQMLYKDYVFSVAGDYVNSYTLQLAHTTNNAYTYEIFEAMVTTAQGKVENKDYVTYTVTQDYPDELPQMDDHSDENVDKGAVLYYTIRMDDNGKKISLNAAGVSENTITASSYTVGGNSVQYNGHYLNQNSTTKLAESTGTYHDKTYDGYGNVEDHAEPLYWQATNIAGGNASNKDPFYNEYILRISWEENATTTYKDTDIICISAKVE